MKRSEISRTMDQLDVDPESIADLQVKQSLVTLLNLVERLAMENQQLQEEVKQLREEIRRLKGDPKLPNAPAKKPPPKNISSEDERKRRQDKSSSMRTSRRTFKNLTVHEEIICPVRKDELPDDARFIGYDDLVVQDVIVHPHNTRFRRERYYSARLDRWYLGTLPDGYQGEFGPHLKALAIALKYVGNMSEPKVLEFFETFGVQISSGTISNILTHLSEPFEQEKADLYRAGLESTFFQQIDDTSATVAGKKHHTQIVCNPLYTAYFTTPRKDRLTILDVLRDFAPRAFRFNEETDRLLRQLRVAEKLIRQLPDLFATDRDYEQSEIDALLEPLFPDPNKGRIHRQHILEAAAIAAYHHQQDIPLVKVLVCDDAGQFKLLTDALALCWIHEGRHYQKLDPVVPLHQQKLAGFRDRFWDYYAQLAEYRRSPSAERADELAAEFEALFSTVTGYEALDLRIAKTLAKKESLLTVLSHPEVPLHNNASELGARVSARRRDVSLHTKSAAGTRAMDVFTTIVQTAKKLGVSAYEYLFDRISGQLELPSLASLIRARAHSPPDKRPFPNPASVPTQAHPPIIQNTCAGV